jgi:hypothetical protein
MKGSGRQTTCQIEFDSNNTLQLKCEKQLHVETSKATIKKKIPHIPIPQNSRHWNKKCNNLQNKLKITDGVFL